MFDPKGPIETFFQVNEKLKWPIIVSDQYTQNSYYRIKLDDQKIIESGEQIHVKILDTN